MRDAIQPAQARAACADRAAAADARHPRVPMDRVLGWELDVLGSHGMAAADYPGMLAMVETGALRPQRLVERVVSLEQAARLLPALEHASPAGITVIDPRA